MGSILQCLYVELGSFGFKECPTLSGKLLVFADGMGISLFSGNPSSTV